MLGLQAERRAPAAVDEVAQVLTAETNHLFDMGLFSLPAAASTPRPEAPRTRRKKEKSQ
jgi:hypothetical protein